MSPLEFSLLLLKVGRNFKRVSMAYRVNILKLVDGHLSEELGGILCGFKRRSFIVYQENSKQDISKWHDGILGESQG
jgi:hypothetical protein